MMCSEARAGAGWEAGSQGERNSQLPAANSHISSADHVNVILRRTGAAQGWWHGESLFTDMRSVKDFGVP